MELTSHVALNGEPSRSLSGFLIHPLWSLRKGTLAVCITAVFPAPKILLPPLTPCKHTSQALMAKSRELNSHLINSEINMCKGLAVDENSGEKRTRLKT